MRRVAKKPDAILCGDFHLRENTPECRTDDFEKAQWKKVDFIYELREKYGCPILHAGDLFNHWKPSPALLTKTMQHLPRSFYTIYGNHDLPQHNLELANKCGINVLQEADMLTVINGTHWGKEPTKLDMDFCYEASAYTQFDNMIGYLRDFLIWHIMTYQIKKPWPDCTDPKASKLLRKYPEYDLILTGHNHQTFVEEYEGRLLVNPGSLTRQEADKVDHKPCVFLYYAETNTVEKVYLPFEKDVISREHLEKKEERDDRIDAFVSRLDKDFEGAISFEDNLEQMIQKNKTPESVTEIIYKAVDTV